VYVGDLLLHLPRGRIRDDPHGITTLSPSAPMAGARHPRWTFHFTPNLGLNAVEGFFAKLTLASVSSAASSNPSSTYNSPSTHIVVLTNTSSRLNGSSDMGAARRSSTVTRPFRARSAPREITCAACANRSGQ